MVADRQEASLEDWWEGCLAGCLVVLGGCLAVSSADRWVGDQVGCLEGRLEGGQEVR